MKGRSMQLIVLLITWPALLTLLLQVQSTFALTASGPNDPLAKNNDFPKSSRHQPGSQSDAAPIFNRVFENGSETVHVSLAHGNQHYSNLVYRQAKDYEASIAKGECLMDMIEDETESQSIYTGGWAQVHASGWGDYDGPEYSLAWPQFWSATGWNKGDFRTYSVSYEQPWIIGALPAYMLLWADTKDGVIIAINVRSPRQPFHPPDYRPPNPAPPPLVNRLSDIMFLAYQDDCRNHNTQGTFAECMKRLTWIVHAMVANPQCQEAGDDATGLEWSEYAVWPGNRFQLDSDEGKALLGCPNGLSAAYLAAQHSKTELGRKTVAEAVVFAEGKFANGQTTGFNLAYRLADYPAATAKRDDVAGSDTAVAAAWLNGTFVDEGVADLGEGYV